METETVFYTGQMYAAHPDNTWYRRFLMLKLNSALEDGAGELLEARAIFCFYNAFLHQDILHQNK